MALQDELYIIDVSQAVDLDHPRALDFLREDVTHVNDFFRRAGIAVLTTRQLFEFVVDPLINQHNLSEALQSLQQLATRYILSSLHVLHTYSFASILSSGQFSICASMNMLGLSEHCTTSVIGYNALHMLLA